MFVFLFLPSSPIHARSRNGRTSSFLGLNRISLCINMHVHYVHFLYLFICLRTHGLIFYHVLTFNDLAFSSASSFIICFQMAIVNDHLSKFLDLPDQKSRLESVPVFSLFLLLIVSLQSFFLFHLHWQSWETFLPGRGLTICLSASWIQKQPGCLSVACTVNFFPQESWSWPESINSAYDLYFRKSSSPLFKYFARGEESSRFP